MTEARALALLGSMAELAENLRKREADLAGLHTWLGSPGDATMTLQSGEEGRLDDPRVRAALQAAAAGLLSYLDHWTGACAAVRAVASEVGE